VEETFQCIRVSKGCDATPEEIEAGKSSLDKWYVLRKYKKQVCGLHHNTPAYVFEMEDQELTFEELIFLKGECIGAYHDELIFLFDDKRTHYQEKYLGEMPTGPDQAIEFYDYYYLCQK